MKYFTNKEAWIWALASLLVISLAILGTMLYQRHLPEKIQEESKSKEFRDAERKKGFTQWREEMGFTDEQDEKLKDLMQIYREATKVIFDDLLKTQNETFEELAKDNPDADKLEALANQTGELHARLRKQTIRHMTQLKAVTTPQQYEKMASMMQQWIFPGQMNRHRSWRPQNTPDSIHDGDCSDHRKKQD